MRRAGTPERAGIDSVASGRGRGWSPQARRRPRRTRWGAGSLLAFWAALAAGAASALTLERVSASWPEPGVRFQPGFVPATLVVPATSGAETRIVWFGPGQSAAEGAALVYRAPTLPLDLSAGAAGGRVALGSVQFENFSTSTKGPVEVVLELDLRFRELGLDATIRIPMEIEHTPDDVLDLGACPAGSVTRCDDVVALLGGPLVLRIGGGLAMPLLGFDATPSDPDANDPVSGFLAPEGRASLARDLLIQIPEPAPAWLVALALAVPGANRLRISR